MSYTVHRGANVFTSHSFTMVTPARPDQLQELNAIGGAAHCLDWVIDGMPGIRPQAAPRSAGTLYEQMIAMGLSETAAQAAVQAAESAGQEFSQGSSADSLPADKLEAARDEALDVVVQLRKHAEGVAKLYLDLFLSRVWAPFAEAGQPQEQWPQVQASLDEVRQLATDALVGAFEVVMGERVGEAFGRELARAGKRRR